MEKLQIKYLTYHNLLIAQDLWQTHYQILCNLIKSNLSVEIHRSKWKFGHNDKKYEICGIKCKNTDWFLEYENFKNDLIE